MLIVHTPAGSEAEQFDLRTVRVNEASIISRTMDTTWTQVKERLRDGDPEAMQVVAWALKKRAEPTLRLADFDPLVDELAVRFDKAEIEEWVTRALERVPDGLTPEQILQALHMVVSAAADQEHARELILRLAAAPKDPVPDAETQGPIGPTEGSMPTVPST